MSQPIDFTTERAQLLRDAQRTITGDRNQQYGEPENNFARIADLWSTLLGSKLQPDARVEPHDVALLMCALKLARLTWQPGNRDSWVDLAGYAACGHEVAEVTS